MVLCATLMVYDYGYDSLRSDDTYYEFNTISLLLFLLSSRNVVKLIMVERVPKMERIICIILLLHDWGQESRSVNLWHHKIKKMKLQSS